MTVEPREARARAFEAELDGLKQAYLVQDVLLQVMLEGGGVSAIVECLAERIGNPVAVADHLFHFIASAPKGEHGDRHRRETISRGGTAREILDDPIVGAPFRHVAAERRPVLFPAFPAHGMDERRLMAPILAGRDILGYVTVLEESTALLDVHATVLRQATLILALELLKQRAVLEAEMGLRADFLRDLFSENYASHETIGMRASLLGIDLFRPWDLLVLEPDSAQELPAAAANHFTAVRARLLDVVRRTARARFPGSVVIPQSEGIVVLRPASAAPVATAGAFELAEALREQVHRTFRESGLSVSAAIGGRCERLADFGRRYAEARRTLEVGRSLGQQDRTLTLESLGIYGILYQRGNREELLRFALRVLGPILEYDGRRHTALLDTLDVYLTERGVLRTTADRLNVHLNTLRGRLQRIRESAGIDLTDAKTRLDLQLALEIYRFDPHAARQSGILAPRGGKAVPGPAAPSPATGPVVG